MYFNVGLQMAVIGLFHQTILANPAVLSRSTTESHTPFRRMAAADAFHRSGLGFETWAKRMVDEGKMYYPEKRTVDIPGPGEKRTVVVRESNGGMSLRQEPKWTFSLDNIVCEGLGGKENDYNKGKDKFCQLVHDASNVALLGVSVTLQRAVCDNFECDFQIQVIENMAGLLGRGRVESYCKNAFSNLRKKCNGKGGSAQIVLKASGIGQTGDLCGVPYCASEGSVNIKAGSFQAQFFDHDDGLRCPANPDTQICRIENF